jgi:hypothetical protein
MLSCIFLVYHILQQLISITILLFSFDQPKVWSNIIQLTGKQDKNGRLSSKVKLPFGLGLIFGGRDNARRSQRKNKTK